MPLTDTQREHLTKRLQDERRRVQELLADQTAELGTSEQDAAGDLSKLPTHQADEGTDTFDTELDASQATRITNELREIDEALERLYREPETFGRDERTGEEIPFERLDIIPWARRTVD